MACLIALALWGVLVSRYSPLLIGFGHWDVGAQGLGRYLQMLTRKIEENPTGGYVEVPPPQRYIPGNPSPITTPLATFVADYSLPAWAELRFPERSIEFREHSSRPLALEPGIWVIGIRDSRRRPAPSR